VLFVSTELIVKSRRGPADCGCRMNVVLHFTLVCCCLLSVSVTANRHETTNRIALPGLSQDHIAMNGGREMKGRGWEGVRNGQWKEGREGGRRKGKGVMF